MQNRHLLKHSGMSRIEVLTINQSANSFFKMWYPDDFDMRAAVKADIRASAKTQDLIYQWSVSQEKVDLEPKRQFWFPWSSTLKSLDLSGNVLEVSMSVAVVTRLNGIMRDEPPVLVDLSIRQVMNSYALFDGMGIYMQSPESKRALGMQTNQFCSTPIPAVHTCRSC